MPREQIVPLLGAKIDNDPKADTPVHGEAWQPPGLHVGWMPTSSIGEGHVQVCLEVDRRYVEYSVQMTTETMGEGNPLMLWSPSLSRTELNKLIRTLRRARDRAYGADE